MPEQKALIGTHPIVILTTVAVLATVLSLIISNVAATVLLVPLVMMTGTGIEPTALALLVAVSASNPFILPTRQVNPS